MIFLFTAIDIKYQLVWNLCISFLIKQIDILKLPLIFTDKSKDVIYKYEEIWSKTEYPIQLKDNSSHDFDEKDMKTRVHSDDYFDYCILHYTSVRLW